MIDDIASRFRANLARVAELSTAGASLEGGGFASQPWFSPHLASDMLRAAVVLLHATLEDLLREIAEWRLPSADPKVLAEIPLLGTKAVHKPSFHLGDLAEHRALTVAELIGRSVEEYLAGASFSNPGEVRRLLRWIGVDDGLVVPHRSELASMMARRHLIAHRVDRMDEKGSLVPRPIEPQAVESWRDAVDRFGSALIESVRPAVSDGPGGTP